jgi:hypothetical protein
MATEKLKFRLELYATWWSQPPKAEILIDNITVFNGLITSNKEKPTIIEFEHLCQEDKNHELVIKRFNKTSKQTVVGPQGEIEKDQLLHIRRIEIDEIDLGSLVYEGIYTPEYPEPWASQQRDSGEVLQESFKNATQLGHNGVWRFSFSSPFYMWLLENLY